MKLICICTNPKCQLKGQRSEIEWDGTSSYALHLATECPMCHERRQTEQGEKQEETNKLLSISAPYIDSLTPNERKKLLKERSNRDFKKNIEEKKRDIDKNIIPKI